ncbi:MAG: sulfite exporter TauE/SafE family protein [Bacteroidia bacterium]
MYTGAAILLGLLGSLHCLGMCGPIALALPVSRSEGLFKQISGLLMYNAGRALTYGLFGAITGLAGGAVSWFAGQQTLSIVTGAVILIVLLLSLFGKKLSIESGAGKMFGKLRQALSSLFNNPRKDALLLIGILNGFLPCGLVYTAMAGAAATGSALDGMLFMMIFGLGTIPAMLALSLAKHKISLSFRTKMTRLVPVFVAVMAILLVLRGMGLGIPYISPEIVAEKGKCVHHCCH